jgi:predicted AAA+ superfamily ATPase
LSPLALRADIGELWENFCIAERLKLNKYHQTWTRMFFWRTYDQKEIDYVEEREGQLAAYEFKWSADRSFKPPKDFLDAYPGTSIERVDRSNYWRFLLAPAGNQAKH